MDGVRLPSIAWTVPLLLIASVAVVSVVAWIIPPLQRALVLHPHSVRRGGQLHRLFTAGWVHADASHLVFNMLTLYFFALTAEGGLGVARFLLLYGSAVVVAFIPTTLRHMNDPRYSSLGASGAVAAVMFSAVLLAPAMKLHLLFLPIPIRGTHYALGYLAYSGWRSFRARGGINHDAHFSGALYGALVTYAFAPARVTETVRNLF